MVTIGSGHPDGFWYPEQGATTVLGPHDSETVTIRPKSPAWAPSRGSQWLVEAYTVSPEALSTTPLMDWRLGRVQPTSDEPLRSRPSDAR